jgi:hypothetical protein
MLLALFSGGAGATRLRIKRDRRIRKSFRGSQETSLALARIMFRQHASRESDMPRAKATTRASWAERLFVSASTLAFTVLMGAVAMGAWRLGHF